MSDEFLPRIAALCRPGVVVDVGANVGQYTTILLSAKNCSVVAFEPFLTSFLELCRKVALLGGGRFPAHVTVYNLAVGAGLSAAQLSVPMAGLRVDHQAASLVKDFEQLAAEMGAADLKAVRQPVVVVPLDTFAFDGVTFMKIDVEGAEMDALLGAAQTIARSRPIILVELEERHRPGATIDVPAWLAERGYRAFFHLDGKVVGFDRFDRAAMHVAPKLPNQPQGFSKPYINEFLFIHQDDTWGHALIEKKAFDWS